MSHATSWAEEWQCSTYACIAGMMRHPLLNRERCHVTTGECESAFKGNEKSRFDVGGVSEVCWMWCSPPTVRTAGLRSSAKSPTLINQPFALYWVRFDGLCWKPPFLFKMVSPRDPYLAPFYFPFILKLLVSKCTWCQNFTFTWILFFSFVMSKFQRTLQSALSVMQKYFNQLHLVFISDETKMMCFLKSWTPDHVCLNGKVIERVSI